MTSSEAGKAAKIMANGESPAKAVVSMFLKSGPWAVMTLALVLGFGYEAHRLVGTAGNAVSSYVIQSSKNNEVLVELGKEGEQQRKDMMSAMEGVASAIELRHQEHQLIEQKYAAQSVKIDLLIKMVEQACTEAPEERKELLGVLTEIKGLLNSLQNDTEK